MESDKFKLTSAIKIFLFFFYLIYFTISNTSLNRVIYNIPAFKTDAELKKELYLNECLLLLGGSNVKMGLSAEGSSTTSCKALNLGIDNEGGGFNNYLKWLNNNTLADKIVYSPALIWSDQKFIRFNKEAQIRFPHISLLSFIKATLLPLDNENTSKFSQFGDQIHYKCPAHYIPFHIDPRKYADANYFISNEIHLRISTLKKITKSSEIFLRIPPIYAANNNEADLLKNLINQRIKIINELGISIVGSTTVSTDKNLFCDSFHPNAKGREVFTKEVILP